MKTSILNEELPKLDMVTGKYLRAGNGCYLCDNCFECLLPANKCVFDGSKKHTHRQEKNFYQEQSLKILKTFYWTGS